MISRLKPLLFTPHPNPLPKGEGTFGKYRHFPIVLFKPVVSLFYKVMEVLEVFNRYGHADEPDI